MQSWSLSEHAVLVSGVLFFRSICFSYKESTSLIFVSSQRPLPQGGCVLTQLQLATQRAYIMKLNVGPPKSFEYLCLAYILFSSLCRGGVGWKCGGGGQRVGCFHLGRGTNLTFTSPSCYLGPEVLAHSRAGSGFLITSTLTLAWGQFCTLESATF